MKRATNTMGGGCLALFGLPFLLAGLAMTGWFYFNAVRWWQSQSWEEVPCTIIAAGLNTSHGKSTTYRATATYRYWFAGHFYTSERVSISAGGDNVSTFHQEVHQELRGYVQKPGSTEDPREFRCYVNPTNPSEAMLYRTLRWQMQAFLAIFCLTFPAVGAGLVVSGLVTMRASRQRSRLETCYPAEPWNWEPGAAEKMLPPSNQGVARALYFYTAWAGLIVGCLFVTTYLSGAFTREPTAWLLLIFLGLWCLPAWFTLRRWRLGRMVGKLHFVPETLPAVPGTWFRGAITLQKPLLTAGLADISLQCSKTSGQGKQSTTAEVWKHEDSVPLSEGTMQIPVNLALPSDALETTQDSSNGGTIAWKLCLALPGNGAETQFVIPVYHTNAPTAPSSPQVPSIMATATQDLTATLAQNKISLSLDETGLPQTIESGSRFAIPITIFALIFTVAVIAVAPTLSRFSRSSSFSDSIFFVARLASFVAVWGFALASWLRRTVQISPLRLSIHHAIGPVQWVKEFAKADIAEFYHDSNTQVNNVLYYRVRLVATSGKKITLTNNIKGESPAAALDELLDQWLETP
jgi:hypothetical protein